MRRLRETIIRTVLTAGTIGARVLPNEAGTKWR